MEGFRHHRHEATPEHKPAVIVSLISQVPGFIHARSVRSLRTTQQTHSERRRFPVGT